MAAKRSLPRQVGSVLAAALSALLWLLGITALVVMAGLPAWLALALFVVALAIAWRTRPPWWIRWMGVDACTVAAIWFVVRTPSNDRDWWQETSVMPRIEQQGDSITIHGFRDFHWHDQEGHDARWVERSFDLAKLDRLELVVEPLADSKLVAHTMLIFGFGDDQRVVVSVEARKEKGEKYALLPAALKQFELIYLFGSEHDFLTVRAVQRKAPLYIYPIVAEREFIHELFLDFAASANDLHENPLFYRILFDNCTTNLARHFDHRLNRKIGLRRETIFPALAGNLLHQLGRMDTDLPYEQAREFFRADPRIIRHRDDPDFSTKIRPKERGFQPAK